MGVQMGTQGGGRVQGGGAGVGNREGVPEYVLYWPSLAIPAHPSLA